MNFGNDVINVTGNKQAAESIIQRYGDFGWKLTENRQDKLYADTVHMTFTRPHFIKNKDELQLLQVRLEIAYNNTGKLAWKCRHCAALIVALVTLLVAAYIVGGVFLVLNGGLYPIIFGAVSFALGAALAASGGIYAGKIYKRDVKKYTVLIKKELDKIDGLCAQAKALRGDYE